MRTPEHVKSFAESVKRLGKRNGDKAPNWRGEKVGYRAIHNWMETLLGKPSKCDHCHITTAKRFDWANVSGQYKRDVSDWLRLCRSCHRKYDDGKRKAKNEERMAA